MRTKTLALASAAALAAVVTASADTTVQAKAANVIDLVQKAEVSAARQSWTAAIDAYKQAVAENAKDPVLRNKLGICYQRAGDAKQARKAYKKAIELRKDYAEAWNNLGTLEHARNRYKQAISHYAKAIQAKPADAVFHKNLGVAWLALGNVDEAAEAWNEAYRIDPAFLASQAVAVPADGVSLARQDYLYAKLLAAHGQTEKALEYLVKAHAQGFHDFARVEGDKDFASLVTDPRYAALK